MSKYTHCCANCSNLEFIEGHDYPHYWCFESEYCPCDGEETPSFDFSCEKYVRDDESLYSD